MGQRLRDGEVSGIRWGNEIGGLGAIRKDGVGRGGDFDGG